MPVSPQSVSPDFIFVSLESWDEIWRRNQFLCAAWTKRHPQSKILFVAPPRVLPLALKKRDLGSLRPKLEAAPGFPNIWVYRPLRLVPSTLPTIRRFNEWHERQQILAVARQIGIESPLLWLNSHFARPMAGQMGERGLIYDITDDWIAFGQSDALRQRITELDTDLCRLADCTIVCSARLFELKKSLAKRLELVPNGVDAAHYARVKSSETAHPITRDWKKPVLGYTGSIHPDRVDVGLVAALAQEFSQGTVALVGPDMLPAAQRERLKQFPNLVLSGPLPYSQIPDAMRAFDVCITPHVETDFTQSLNPIKLWEYLAAGKPIVSTDVAGFRDYPELVKIASGAPAFVAACREALQGDDLSVRRQAIAQNNSWESRLNDVEKIVVEVRG
jgi:glycosyltransferase involved in cell wall biosynthesis